MQVSSFSVKLAKGWLAGHIALQFQHAGGLAFNSHIPKEGKGQHSLAQGGAVLQAAERILEVNILQGSRQSWHGKCRRGERRIAEGKPLQVLLNGNRLSSEGITLGMD